MEQTYLDYLYLLRKLGGIFDQLSALAQDKTMVVRSSRFAELERIINREQVISLSLRNLEQKRSKLLEEMELSGIPLSDLLRHYPRKLQAQAEQAAESVQSRYHAYRGNAEIARNTLECNLQEIEKIVDSIGVVSKGDFTYGPYKIAPQNFTIVNRRI